MTIAWSPCLLAYADDKDDQDQATDGQSRFCAYIADRLDSFHEYHEPDTPHPPAEFAAAAWYVTTPPAMAPGYVRLRPDLTRVTLEHHDEDPAHWSPSSSCHSPTARCPAASRTRGATERPVRVHRR